MENNKIFKVEAAERHEVVEKLIRESSPRRSFFFMIIIATALATLGLIMDSVAVVIGAMLVAPLLSPVLNIGMGIVITDFRVIRLALVSVVQSIIFGVIISAAIMLLNLHNQTDFALLYGLKPEMLFVYVAFLSGLAGAYALGNPSLGEYLPGVAISVALVPPLAGIGIGIALLDWQIISQTLTLFGINLICIILMSVLVFQLMGYHRERKSAEKAVQKEEKILKEE